MTSLIFKQGVKIGLITAGVILVFEISNLLLVYKYFRFDYYLTGVALVFLVVGFFLSKWNNQKIRQPDTDKLSRLTSKELYILQLIADGKSNKEIAAVNFVEISTIKTHINNIYTKLGISNRKEAVNKYKSTLYPPA